MTCIHDGIRDSVQTAGVDEEVTHTTCHDCGALLYDTIMRYDGLTPVISRWIADDVYRMLYTREGRSLLTQTSLREAGITDWPGFWSDEFKAKMDKFLEAREQR